MCGLVFEIRCLRERNTEAVHITKSKNELANEQSEVIESKVEFCFCVFDYLVRYALSCLQLRGVARLCFRM